MTATNIQNRVERQYEATDQKAFHSLCDYARYNSLLSECDAGLSPLHDTRRNRLKSDLKFIAWATHGVAAVASNVLYSPTSEDGRTGRRPS